MRAGEGVVQVQSDDPAQDGRDARDHLDDLRGVGSRGGVTRGRGRAPQGTQNRVPPRVQAGWGGWEEPGGGAAHRVERLRTTGLQKSVGNP